MGPATSGKRSLRADCRYRVRECGRGRGGRRMAGRLVLLLSLAAQIAAGCAVTPTTTPSTEMMVIIDRSARRSRDMRWRRAMKNSKNIIAGAFRAPPCGARHQI